MELSKNLKKRRLLEAFNDPELELNKKNKVDEKMVTTTINENAIANENLLSIPSPGATTTTGTTTTGTTTTDTVEFQAKDRYLGNRPTDAATITSVAISHVEPEKVHKPTHVGAQTEDRLIGNRPVTAATTTDPKNEINVAATTSFVTTTNINESKLKILSPHLFNVVDIKIKRLEQWEITKRQALERLAQDMEELREKEEEIENKTEIYNKFKKKLSSSKLIENVLQQSASSSIDNETNIIKNNNQRKNKKSLKFTSNENSFKDKPEEMIVLGPHGTSIPAKIYAQIKWEVPTAATRKLLMTIFDRNTLAFHTLTGKPSPAFMGFVDRPLKNRLDPLKVNDIIYAVMLRSQAPERDIRSAITTKCADENKMYRQREKRRHSFNNTTTCTISSTTNVDAVHTTDENK